jgi:hypothetical protein
MTMENFWFAIFMLCWLEFGRRFAARDSGIKTEWQTWFFVIMWPAIAFAHGCEELWRKK